MTSPHAAQPILVVGPLPPPIHGPAVFTRCLLDHPVLNGRFVLKHLDTTDRRPLSNMGRLDWVNLWLALKHFAGLVVALAVDRPGVVYYPISQNALAFLRDALLLGPAILARKRLVFHLHGSVFRRFYETAARPLQALIRYILGRAARVIVLSDNLRYLFEGLVAAERVEVVPNAVDHLPFERLRPQVSRPAGNGLQVTYLGNLVEGKGYRQVLEAAPQVLAGAPNSRLTLAGSVIRPERQRECEQFVADHALQDRVTFAGQIDGDAKVRLLLATDVFVFPPVRPEGQPLVILEAMAAGLPIVTTDQGAIAEMVPDGDNGFIVPARDPQALAEKILMLLNDAALRQKMGEASRDRFLAYYTLERWARDMARVFQQVLDEP